MIGIALHPTPTVRVTGRDRDAPTQVVSMGAYGITLLTTVPDLAIDLQSTYVGHPRTDTEITYLLLAPSNCLTERRTARAADLPLQHSRRLCLYDHFHRLQQFIADEHGDASVPIDVVDSAVAVMDR